MKPIVLIILDGWGLGPAAPSNAIHLAKTPNFQWIEENFPMTALQASGISVGISWGEVGNSEVGHLTIGAGKVIYQSLPRVIFSIQDGSFFQNEALLKTTNNVKEKKSVLHLAGIVTSASVHGYIDHLYGLLELAKQQNVEKVILHIWTDGRDAMPYGAAKLITNLKERLETMPNVKIGTIMGRGISMDRNFYWERTKKAYDAMTFGAGEKIKDPVEYLKNNYEKNITDEFIEPGIITDEQNNPIGTIKEGDSLIIFNFREDRVRQITKSFCLKNFDFFERKYVPNLTIATMTEYEKNLPVSVAFPPIEINNTLSEVLAQNDKTQVHIAETEKYAHITFFFNGGKEEKVKGEDRILIPSQRVEHFDEYPEMRAMEIADKVIEAIQSEKYDFIAVNFANADMVGHTGNIEATKQAVEMIDQSVGRILVEVLQREAVTLITADHGNAESIYNPYTGEMKTKHTMNPVPFYLIANKFRRQKDLYTPLDNESSVGGLLADIAPTVLELMEIKKPKEMSGESLIEKLI